MWSRASCGRGWRDGWSAWSRSGESGADGWGGWAAKLTLGSAGLYPGM